MSNVFSLCCEGNCPEGHFSVEGRCVSCFCAGITKNCKGTGRYRNHITLRFTDEEDFKGTEMTNVYETDSRPKALPDETPLKVRLSESVLVFQEWTSPTPLGQTHLLSPLHNSSLTPRWKSSNSSTCHVVSSTLTPFGPCLASSWTTR